MDVLMMAMIGSTLDPSGENWLGYNRGQSKNNHEFSDLVGQINNECLEKMFNELKQNKNFTHDKYNSRINVLELSKIFNKYFIVPDYIPHSKRWMGIVEDEDNTGHAYNFLTYKENNRNKSKQDGGN